MMFFWVALSETASAPVQFDITTADGTATAGSDYTAVAWQGATINPGEPGKLFVVDVSGDSTWEADETFAVAISNVTGANLVDGQAVGTITNDDATPGPALSIADVAIAEGGPGEHLVSYTVSLSAPTDTPVYFDVATADGTANGRDYVGSTLHGAWIDAGQTSFSNSFTIIGDDYFEPDETVLLNVSNVQGHAYLADGQAVVTVLNDDAPGLTIDDLYIDEGNAGTSTATFTVRLPALPGAAAGE